MLGLGFAGGDGCTGRIAAGWTGLLGGAAPRGRVRSVARTGALVALAGVTGSGKPSAAGEEGTGAMTGTLRSSGADTVPDEPPLAMLTRGPSGSFATDAGRGC